jgi:hypothetical protein
MEGREKPHMDKYVEIVSDWNCDTSCMFTTCPVLDLENFRCLIFVAQSVQIIIVIVVSEVLTATIITLMMEAVSPSEMSVNFY